MHSLDNGTTALDSLAARRPAASHLSLVFRRGGALSALLRHGPHVRNVGIHESRALQVALPPGIVPSLPVLAISNSAAAGAQGRV